MEQIYSLLAIAGVFYAVVIPLAALVAFVRTSRLQREIRRLQHRLDFQLADDRPVVTPSTEAEAHPRGREMPPHVQPAAMSVTEKSTSWREISSTPVEPEPAPLPDAGSAAEKPAENDGKPAARDDAPASQSAPAPIIKPLQGVEGELASKWLVWAGGIALALGGIFMARYAISVGVLTPVVRIVLGIAAGAAMLSSGEAVRRRVVKLSLPVANADRVPAVLGGAGLITLYGSVFAADSFYGLIPPLLAFALLAMVSLGAVAVALLHGPAIGLLGLIGAMVVPLLVHSDAPSPWSLFGYLGFVTGVMAMASYTRNWIWLGWTALGGAAAWVVFWLVLGSAGDHLPVGLFVVFIAALPLWLPAPLYSGAGLPVLTGFVRNPLFVWGAVTAFLAFLTLRTWSYDTVSLAVLAAIAGLSLAGAWNAPARLGLVLAALVAVLAGVAAWDVPSFVPRDFAPGLDIFGGAPIPAPEFSRFAWVAFGFAGLYFATGFAAIGRVRFAGLWAALSAGVPPVLLFLAYWRWTGFDTDQNWAAAGLGLAAVSVIAASRFPAARAPMGAYATATIAGLSLALAMVLREAWLSVALALQLPAIAMIANRLDLRPLRTVALIIAGIAMARLLLNPYLLSYPLGDTSVFNWILYGYGIPAIAFWAAAKTLRKARDDLPVALLEAGAIAFVICLVSFQIRNYFAGTLVAEYDNLWEISLHSAVWVALSYALYANGALSARPVLHWASIVLRGVGAAQIVLVHCLLLNPALTVVYVGKWPLFNVAGLAYLLPAVFALFYLRAAQRKGDHQTGLIAGAMAVGLGFVYVSVEVVRAFRGAVPLLEGSGEAEQYALSVVWLAYACALLGLGLWRGNRLLRHVGLGVLLLTTLKVFLFDMNNLTGALRAVSFLGLGIVLIAIGYVYQRFIQPSGQAGADSAPPAGNPGASEGKSP